MKHAPSWSQGSWYAWLGLLNCWVARLIGRAWGAWIGVVDRVHYDMVWSSPCEMSSQRYYLITQQYYILFLDSSSLHSFHHERVFGMWYLHIHLDRINNIGYWMVTLLIAHDIVHWQCKNASLINFVDQHDQHVMLPLVCTAVPTSTCGAWSKCLYFISTLFDYVNTIWAHYRTHWLQLPSSYARIFQRLVSECKYLQVSAFSFSALWNLWQWQCKKPLSICFFWVE